MGTFLPALVAVGGCELVVESFEVNGTGALGSRIDTPSPSMPHGADRVTLSRQWVGYFSRNKLSRRLSCNFSPAVLGTPVVSSVSAASWWAKVRTATSLWMSMASE